MRMGRMIALTVLIIPFAGTFAAAEEDLWQAYIELKGGGSSPRWLGQGSLFLPLAQDRETLVFADLRGLMAESDAVEGNWGFGYRRMIDAEAIFGVYAFYDLRHSENNNLFHQATVGAEYLTTDWALRVNGYIPDQSVKAVAGAGAVQQQGNNILVRAGLEAAYWGFDFEAETMLWSRSAAPSEGCGSNRRKKLRDVNAEFWATAGMFYFDHSGSGFRQVSGPRVRAELRLFDLPRLGQDSRLVLTGQYEYDKVRGEVSTGLLTLRVPIGPDRCRPKLRGLNRRMVTPVIRDIDVITDAGAFGTPEPAKFSTNGNRVSDVVIVTSRDKLAAAVRKAGKDSIVIVDGSAGDFRLRNTVDLHRGQTIIGGGSQLQVVGENSGATAVFNTPGSRPTIFGPRGRNDVFRIADRSTIVGIDTFGGRHGVSGRNVRGFTLRDLDIRDAWSDGIHLRGRNGGQIVDVDVRRNGGNGIYVDSFGRGLISGNVARRNNRSGIHIGHLRNATVSDNVSRENFKGFQVDSMSSGQFTNNLAGRNRDRGIDFKSLQGGTVSDNLSRNNRRAGFNVAVNHGGDIVDNTSTGNGRDGFRVDTFVSGSLKGNTSANNSGTGFTIGKQFGGAVTGNTAERNQTGFDVSFGGHKRIPIPKGPPGGKIPPKFDPSVFSNNTATNNRKAGFLTRGLPSSAENNRGSGNGGNDIGPMTP